jgi:hypothetical protein
LRKRSDSDIDADIMSGTITPTDNRAVDRRNGDARRRAGLNFG